MREGVKDLGQRLMGFIPPDSVVAKWRDFTPFASAVLRRSYVSKIRSPAPLAPTLEAVEAILRFARYADAPLLDFDGWPPQQRVLDDLAAGRPIGDCQAFAVLACALLSRLPPSEGVTAVRAVAFWARRPDGSAYGHAMAAFERRGRWMLMGQSGVFHAVSESSWEHPLDGLRAHARDRHRAQVLAWAQFRWSTGSVMTAAEVRV